MDIKQSYDVILELLKVAALASRSRFDDELLKYAKESPDGYIDPKQRVAMIKKYGTVRVAIGRSAGHTQAAIDLAKTFYKDQTVAFVGPCTDFLNELQERTGNDKNIIIRPWNDAESLSDRHLDIRAIFVDPGPHAGCKAREAIYWSAAKAMDSQNGYKPVLVYFIGS